MLSLHSAAEMKMEVEEERRLSQEKEEPVEQAFELEHDENTVWLCTSE